MGLRGPKRKPNSRRAKAEARKAQRDAENMAAHATAHAPVGDIAPISGSGVPTCPEWLSETGRKTWHNLVALLADAEVPIKAVDAYALGMAAYCLAAVAEWAARENDGAISLAARLGISKLVQKYQSDSQSWLQKIGASPSARMAMGIRETAKQTAAADDPWSQL